MCNVLGLWLTATLAALMGNANPKGGPINLDFEDGHVGQPPVAWQLTTPEYQATVMDEGPKRGKHCVRVSLKDGATPSPRAVGVLLQSCDAEPYRGKLVRLRGALRIDPAAPADRVQLWMRVDRPDKKTGFFDNMDDRPVREAAWSYHDIVGDVDSDAEEIYFGLLMFGGSPAWLDDVSLEILGNSQPRVEEAPRPLEGRGLDNLIAFTRLLGYVRHFHPSDEASATDWDSFAIAGVRAVEGAESPEELARRLGELFCPIAPTVRVYPTGDTPAVPRGLTAPEPGGELDVLAWEHHGFGAARGPANLDSTYRSRRFREEVRDGTLPAGLHDPAKPLAADLGGGVSCLVPMAVFADAQGTIPRGGDPGDRAAGAAPAGRTRSSGDDRATRLAAVALGWNIMQHFYPYFDVVQADWPAELPRALEAAAIDPDGLAFGGTLRRMIAALHDGHGGVYHVGDAAKASLPVSWDWVEDRLVITSVPKAGIFGFGAVVLKPGEVIRTVDGRSAADALADVERLISAATPQWRRYRGLASLAAGEPHEPVAMEVEGHTGKVRSVSLKRSATPMDSHEPRPPQISEVEPGIMYLDIDRITDADFLEALPRLEQARAIVFDFRGYPSNLSAWTFFPHIVDRPITSQQWHVPVLRSPDREDVTFARGGEWQISPKAPYLRARKVFIIDGRAISYAESCMGIVEHYRLGEIVGSPTAGTNGNVNPFVLPGDYRVTWTGMKVLKHDGSRHHGVGILPTVPVSRTIAGIAVGRDELLEKAIEVADADASVP